jgi:hypothetical protein
MKPYLARWLRIAVPVVAVAAVVVGLVGFGGSGGSGGFQDKRLEVVSGTGAISLVAYDSCQSALDELRGAVLPLVGPYGLGGSGMIAEDSAGGRVPPVPLPPGAVPKAPNGAGAAAPERAAPAESAPGPAQAPDHSSTNTHEAGVDEPDLVKTDGRRLVTITDGKLRVIDVASRKLVATLQVPGGPATQLLLSGDRALVITGPDGLMVPDGRPVPGKRPAVPYNGYQSQLVLVDLSGGAAVIGTLSVEGGYLDARQLGPVARVVVRSAPRLAFVYPDGTRSQEEALQRNREIVRSSPVSDWLPRYRLEQGGRVSSGQLVDCPAVSHPESYTGTSMLTVLTFDLSRELGTGDPVSIVADGDTVYGTGSSLYVADDHNLRRQFGGGPAVPPGGFAPQPAQRTEVYQFDISRPGKPVFVASGGVDGVLLNQYSLSEFGGRLRIATTFNQPGPCCDQPGRAESMITVLARNGDGLAPVGKVAGLGVGERIYAVRFFGPVAYVVTFRQTDPLYTVDLSDPAHPQVAGELKINGYSAYLHAAGDGRLIGVGQDATEAGRRTGTQVSLFDIGNLAAARRVAQFQLTGGTSEVEYDPHAFLYWPEKGLLVVPVMEQWRGERGKPAGGALVLKLGGDAFTELGTIAHPSDPYGGMVRRALVIGDELWTVSAAGAQANAVDGLAQRAWIPFT